ncbi:MAG TPA: hypothetical protein PKX07_03590 [Aggregatilineales bacterium]|nr:hypothetical protein [Aggregatilineales bacterium]
MKILASVLLALLTTRIVIRCESAAREQMRADECITLAGQARVEIPSIEHLYSAITPAKG